MVTFRKESGAAKNCISSVAVVGVMVTVPSEPPSMMGSTAVPGARPAAVALKADGWGEKASVRRGRLMVCPENAEIV